MRGFAVVLFLLCAMTACAEASRPQDIWCEQHPEEVALAIQRGRYADEVDRGLVAIIAREGADNPFYADEWQEMQGSTPYRSACADTASAAGVEVDRSAPQGQNLLLLALFVVGALALIAIVRNVAVGIFVGGGE